MSVTPPKTVAFHGVLFLIAASILWSLNGAFINLINRQGAGPSGITISCMRSLFAGIFLLPLTLRKWNTLGNRNERGEWKLKRAVPACILFFTAMTACFVIANTMTHSANAIFLQYTSTFWVFWLSPILLRERASSGDVRCLILALAGIAVILVGNAGETLPGLLIALLAGFFYALLTMMLRKLRDSDSAVLTVMNCLGSAMLLTPFVILEGAANLTMRATLLLMLMGGVQLGLPYYLYSQGLVRVPAHQAALITLLEPALVPVWVYLAVGKAAPAMTLIGGALILAAFVWVVIRAANRSTRTESVATANAHSGEP